MDIRSQRTKQVIAESFLQLLRQKPAPKITVTEVCRLADINRATFYKHYLDIPQLQESLEQEVLGEFEAFLQSGGFSGQTGHRTVLVQMLDYIRRNGSRFYLLCSGNAGSELPAKAFQLVNAHAFPLMREKLPGVDPERAELLYQFLTRGCGALLVGWLRGEGTMTAEEMADFILRLSGGAVDAVAEGGI